MPLHSFEKKRGIKALRNYMDMQKGDVPATWADVSLFKILTGYQPSTSINTGISAFIKWYRGYYIV